MAFPFLFLAASLASGILISSHISLPLQVLVLTLICFLGSAWIFYFRKKNKTAFIFILLSTFFLGACLYSLANKKYEENSLRKFKSSSYVDFYGTLYKSPSRGLDRDFLYLKVNKVLYQKKEEPIRGHLRVTVFHSPESSSLSNLYIHDKVKISTKILPRKGFQNFGAYSTDIYLKSQNIHNKAFTKSPLLVEKIRSGKNLSPLHWISIIRHKFQKKIEKHFSLSESTSLSSQGAILEALLLGERRRMEPSDVQALQKAGLYHLFAISGAHIAIISFLLFSLFKLVRISTRFSYLLIIVFLLFYAYLVEGKPSIMRATIMTLAFLLGKLIWKTVNLINTISISAFFLLLINPFSLFNVGFQLTFAATLSIILFFPRIIKFLPRLPLRISEILVISLTALLGTLPFVVSTFNRVTFSSLILNLAALPLVGLIMACGFIFLPLAFISSSLAQPLIEGLKFLINLLMSTAYLSDMLPFLSYRIPTPHMAVIIGYFLFFLLMLLPTKIKRQKPIVFFCYFVFLALLISYPFPSHSKYLKFTFIDVGQGESILVEFPGCKKMLIDGGGFPWGTFDIGESVVAPFLWGKGIKRINYLVLTHAHPDHLLGLLAVGRNFRISEYWEAYSPTKNKAYAELKRELSSSVIKRRKFRGDSHQEGKVKIEVLHPAQKEPYVDAVHNDQSLVLRFTYNHISFLLTGDIGINAETEILQSAENISCDVFKSPHHGSLSSSSKKFLKKASPEIIVISVGTGNIYGFPDKEILQRYKETQADVYRTDLHGAVEIGTDGRKIFIRTAAGTSEESFFP